MGGGAHLVTKPIIFTCLLLPASRHVILNGPRDPGPARSPRRDEAVTGSSSCSAAGASHLSSVTLQNLHLLIQKQKRKAAREHFPYRCNDEHRCRDRLLQVKHRDMTASPRLMTKSLPGLLLRIKRQTRVNVDPEQASVSQASTDMNTL